MLSSFQLITLVLMIFNLANASPVPGDSESTSKTTAAAESSSTKSSSGSSSSSFSYFMLNGEPLNTEDLNKNITLDQMKVGVLPTSTETSSSSVSGSKTSTSAKSTSTSTNSTSNSTSNIASSSMTNTTGLTGSEGYETLFLWEIYSRILDTQKDKLQSLLLKDDYNSLSKNAPFSTDLMKALILASHKDPTDAQKKLVSGLTDKATTDGNYLQNALYNVSGGFEASWDPSVVYSGLSNYVEAWETFNAELPNLIRATAQSSRIAWIKQLYTVNSAVNNKKFIHFFTKVEKNVKVLNDCGIKYNATSKYISFSSSNDYTSLDSAVSGYNKKVNNNDLTTTLIREVQITYESASRMLDLWSNAASAT